MKWKITFLEEAVEDINKLDNSSKIQVVKAINKASINPLPQSEGGYGKPLGNKIGSRLSGLFKIKLKKLGIRIVYKIERAEHKMIIVIVSVRSDGEVYKNAGKRIS